MDRTKKSREEESASSDLFQLRRQTRARRKTVPDVQPLCGTWGFRLPRGPLGLAFSVRAGQDSPPHPLAPAPLADGSGDSLEDL